MKLGEIYNLIVELGKKNDPRGKDGVEEFLKQQNAKFQELNSEEKKEFDQENLRNPYSDTRLLYGDPRRDIKTILAGIDIEIGELLLADNLRAKGKQVDLVLAHHPEGKALASLYDVMHLQEDILYRLGVPINIAEDIMASRISEVKRGMMPLNHNKTVDAAKILDLPLMCAHTPADNMVNTFLENLFAKRKPTTVGDILKILKEIPEYQEATKTNAGPTIFVGSKERRTGKIFVDMTGGTSGSEDAFAKLAQAGIGTLVGMHMGEKHRKEAEKNHLNVVIAGHMSSDSLGMNLLLDELEKRGVEVISCSGLIRYKRQN
ncbi:MAG TPA: NGG1p interacting factor NIF3 [Clostridia bacterium]|jgi:putative NIF3 family GTP cyclohydrolase 1 type 2|nr:NGG1p interacting factor NIF3 [Clostridia bacterium]